MKIPEEKGITLIALIVTIIVLIILAGVSIAVLTGDNGIIRKTQSTSKDAEIESVKEQALLDISSWVYDEVTSKRDGIVNTPEQVKQILESENSGKKKYYKGFTDEGVETPSGYIVPYKDLYNVGEIKWEQVLADATTPHPDQSSSNTTIAVGTDGKLVNMDYWSANKVTIDGVEGYGLYSDYNSNESSEKGYVSTFTSSGEIKGTVPQYIKGDGDTKFYPVISMGYTFSYCTGLEIAPEIPTTVINMNGTFLKCTNLKSAPTIPESVKCMNMTFSHCSNLTGEIIINANPSKNQTSGGNIFMDPTAVGGITGCFYNAATNAGTNLVLKGSSTVLNELLATKGTSSNISKGN